MTGKMNKTIHLSLNQQQIELLDRTLVSTGDKTREALVRRALREAAKKKDA